MEAPSVQFEPDDLGPTDFTVTQELRDSNAVLDDPQRLRQIFEDEGYLLFRNVLDLDSVTRARRKMIEVLARRGMVQPGAEKPEWTGAGWGDLNEDSAEFDGLGPELAEHPNNMAFFNRVLGETGLIVPIVQYRFYPPGFSLGMPHQDGYFTQIDGYMGVWVPLNEITGEMGGLGVAVGQVRRGYLHDVRKPPPSPIPKDAIPADAWGRADYQPGDVLILHERTPHCALENHSNILRLSFDIRLVPQSSAQNMFVGTVTAVDPASLSLRSDRGESITIRVDEDTYIRCAPGMAIRVPLSELTNAAAPGSRLLALHDGNHATMLRRASGA